MKTSNAAWSQARTRIAVRRLLDIGLLAILICASAFAQTEVRQAVVLPSYKDLKFPPLPPLKLPQPTIVTLSNGMKVYMLEDHELPLVSGVAIIRTGNLFDPADKHGVAELTGEVLRSGGTKNKTGDQLDVQLENIAASVESNIGETSGTLSFSCLKENTDEVLGVFHDFMTQPEFRQDKVELEKTQMRSSISRRNDDPNGILQREFADIVYGRETPYGWDINYADINRIHRKDLVDFYKRYYFPSNIILGIYGDFAVSEMKTRLEKLFGGWTYTQPPVPKFPGVQGTPVPGVFVADKNDVTQTFFEVGHLGGVLSDKDYPALEVAADILGGGFSSRLFQRVRTQLGYAYNIGASWGANFDHPGLFEITGSTQSRYTVPTIKAVLEEVNRLRSGEVTEAELKTAKDTVLNGFVFNFDRPSKTLNRMLIYAYYGYPNDFIFGYQKSVAGVTRADILRVAKEYLKPQDLTIVAVGNPKDFSTPITALGLKVLPIDLSIPEPKTESEHSEAPQDAASSARAVALLKRVQTALGGAEKMAAIKDIDCTADIALNTPGGELKGTQRNVFVAPSSFRQDLDLPVAKQSVYSDGKTGWMAGQGRQVPLPGPVLKQVQGETFRIIYRLALNENPRLIDDHTVELTDGSNTARLVVDDKTGLPLKVTYSSVGPTGPAQVEETYSDWRDVNGIKVAFARTITQGGAKFADLHLRDCKINSGITAEQLNKKS